MAMTLVSTVTVGSGGAASIEFTNIPQTGKDLLLVASVRSSNAENYTYVDINNDTTDSNYLRRALRGDGSSVISFGSNFRPAFASPTSSYTANTFGNGQLYISNYTSSQNKSISNDHVTENNATDSLLQIQAGSWSNASAVTALRIRISSGTIVQHSTASLYLVS